MLTESEHEWLEDRKRVAYCRYCNVSTLCANPFASGYSCPLTGNMKDAAEFEARVAAKLADSISNELNFVSGKSVVQEAVEYRGKRHTIAWARLKLARLKVEEAMDGHNDA